ncbi:deoxyhypusine hydroxylase [Orbilia oligospora]|uniref:Deoxyhypusine hydroxylase n=1 Tax=Orbilia oligospora TaxID=2813651 RepID=A0A6G1M0Y9_ORBOL|nr:deoxyhypusine hydroxylase [Orbilia oligospora]KAF3207066.1 deoxyhypusine hydroxylase [Orbilia oligospora]KAF3212702.1 deoxyhypusine hydroxylase [Orbilia oligospora]KAF3218077.1 deoxyhypusine hydroxylase [Orbilia oligospora]KAF3241054.1 deoxyhypusine hydroxylase [Orbilia oligospora]
METVSQLQTVLCDESANLALRFRALFSLKHLGVNGDLKAIDAIAAAFSSESALLKHELAYCLGQTKNDYAIKPLRERLDDLNEAAICRHESAEALAAIGGADSLPLLRKYLDDPEEAVRQTCELSIAKIEYDLSEQAKNEDLQKSAFASIDPAPPLPSKIKSISELQDTMNDQSLTLFYRYRAMFRLRDIGTPEAIDALASGFADSSALFRHEIAFIFGQMSDPHSKDALLKVLADTKEDGMVRHEAAEALGSIGLPEIDEELLKYINDPEKLVRDSAIVALDMSEFEKSGELEYALIPGDVRA